jgi:hypothetical protein
MVQGLHRGARLLCRANAVESLTALYLAGAEAVAALPEVAGAALARLVLPTTVELPAAADLGAREVVVPAGWTGRPLRDLGSGLVCVAVRRPDGTVQLGPQAGAPLAAGERLILFGPRGAPPLQ